MKKVISAIIVVFMAMGLTSCGKSYEDLQGIARVNARSVYEAVRGALNENPGMQLANTSIYNMSNSNMKISFDRSAVIDLADFLGKDFKGYFYAEIDPYSRSVEYALWSDHTIDLDYYDYVEYTDRAYFDGTGYIIGYWA